MKVVVIANQKVGVGKTTTALNLGAALANRGKRILLIDLDPQANLSSGIGFTSNFLKDKWDDSDNAPYKSIYDILINKEKISKVFVPTNTENLFLVPSHLSLAGAEVEMVNILSRESILKHAIEEFYEKMDCVIVDCPPSLGLLTINALNAAQELVIPIQCEYYALEGLGQLMKTTQIVKTINPDLNIGGVVLTMFDSRTRLSENVVADVKKHFSDIVFKTIVPRNVRLSEAPSHGKTIQQYDPKSSGALAYKKLAGEFIKRLM